jgi:hypothetical protein
LSLASRMWLPVRTLGLRLHCAPQAEGRSAGRQRRLVLAGPHCLVIWSLQPEYGCYSMAMLVAKEWPQWYCNITVWPYGLVT